MSIHTQEYSKAHVNAHAHTCTYTSAPSAVSSIYKLVHWVSAFQGVRGARREKSFRSLRCSLLRGVHKVGVHCKYEQVESIIILSTL